MKIPFEELIGLGRDSFLEESAKEISKCWRIIAITGIRAAQIVKDDGGVSEGDGMYLAPEDRVAIW